MGDQVAWGAVLLHDKREPDFKVCAPTGGRITAVKRGARRFVEEITIETDPDAPEEAFPAFSMDDLASIDRDAALGRVGADGGVT